MKERKQKDMSRTPKFSQFRTLHGHIQLREGRKPVTSIKR